MQHATRTILFIAYGNPLRGDDGAGIELARRVYGQLRIANCELRIHLCEQQQLVPELVNEIADPSISAVYFFDCSVQGTSSKGQITDHGIQIRSLQPATCTSTPFGHHFTPQTLLVMASALNGISPPAWLVTVPGSNFGMGEGFSDEVAQMLNDAPELAKLIIDTVR